MKISSQCLSKKMRSNRIFQKCFPSKCILSQALMHDFQIHFVFKPYHHIIVVLISQRKHYKNIYLWYKYKYKTVINNLCHYLYLFLFSILIISISSFIWSNLLFLIFKNVECLLVCPDTNWPLSFSQNWYWYWKFQYWFIICKKWS